MAATVSRLKYNVACTRFLATDRRDPENRVRVFAVITG